MWPCVAWLKHDLLTFTSKFKVKEKRKKTAAINLNWMAYTH